MGLPLESDGLLLETTEFDSDGESPASDGDTEDVFEEAEDAPADDGRYALPVLSASTDARVRGRTESRKQITRELRRKRLEGDPEEADLPELLAELERLRPRRRSDCVNGMRPCIYVSCKHHLFLDVKPDTGSVKFNFPDKDLWELEHTCALDVADMGGITLEEVGEIMNLTRERVRQVETRGISGLRKKVDDPPAEPGESPASGGD